MLEVLPGTLGPAVSFPKGQIPVVGPGLVHVMCVNDTKMDSARQFFQVIPSLAHMNMLLDPRYLGFGASGSLWPVPALHPHPQTVTLHLFIH